MGTYAVKVWASYECEVFANNREEAEEKAIDESSFSYADYCEVHHIKRHKYKVTVWVSYECEVEAKNEEEAEEIAVYESPFPYADYCETYEVI